MSNVYSDFEEYILKHGFLFLGEGSFRAAFRRRNVVIKIPICPDGIADNIIEAASYRKYKNNRTSRGLFLAPCRLLPNGCLMMMAVNCDTPWSTLPDWTHNIEGSQAGKYNDRYVAYDYALEIEERDQWENERGIWSKFFHNEWLKKDKRNGVQ